MPFSHHLNWVPVASIVLVQPAHAVVYQSVEEVQRLLFGNESLEAVPLTLTAAQAAAVERASGVRYRPGTLRLWKSTGGYLAIDAVVGKHDLITYAVALTTDGAVRTVEILEYREAYGGEVRSAGFRQQFVGRRSSDPVTVGRDIHNVSGATLSCQHVTDGIRRLLAIYAVALAPAPNGHS
jgi:hypothetical protein